MTTKPDESDVPTRPITLREHYAGHALAGLLASRGLQCLGIPETARVAVLAADALLAELEKGG